MQTRAVVGIVAAALLLAGCAGSGGLFRDRSEQAEAARLLQQRQADEEAALREAEAEAEAARERERKRALQAQQEAEEEADRRKRDEAADLEQERRHRRERKEAEHDAELRELYRGTQAPAKLPPELENYLNAFDRNAAALTEAARIVSECSLPDTVREQKECKRRLRQDWAIEKSNEADADAAAAIGMIPQGAALALWWRLQETEESKATHATSAAIIKAQDERNAAREIYNDAVDAYNAAPAHSDADEGAVMAAAWRKARAAQRRLAKAGTADAAAWRAKATRARLIITPEAYHKLQQQLESQTAATGPAQ